MISDYLKAKLATEIPSILTATSHLENGKQVIRINGASAIVGPFASDNEVEAGIRSALDIPAPVAEPAIASAVASTPLPAVNLTEPKPMTAPSGSFAASIRAMMDEARAGVAQARSEGLAKVGEAVSKLNEAKAATGLVAGRMAKTIEDEAASVLSELGQISNDLGG